MDSQKISVLIKKLRKEKNLSQQALADTLGVSPKTISKWECSKGMPDISMLKKLGDVFDITVDELLEGKQRKPSIVKKQNKFIILPIIILLILIIVALTLYTKENNQTKTNNCTVVRTYHLDNISPSNDENYTYITVSEYQVEGTFTIKVSKALTKDIEKGNNYEFTFNTKEEYVLSTTDILFENSEIINLEYTDKVGMETTSTSGCN